MPELTLLQMRNDDVAYLVGPPKSLLSKLENELLGKPWETVHEGMSVKLLEQEGELYVQARSGDRQKKENAMRRRKFKELVHGLNRLKRRKRISRDQLLRRVAVLKKEAHILVAFLGYCLTVTLRMKLRHSAPGLTPRKALKMLGAIQMVDVEIPTQDGRVLVLRRHTEPEAEQEMILQKLNLSLPDQPPPRIRGMQAVMPESKPA